MPVEIYRSTDASAPVLTGQYGSLITVLDAVLVDGYGSKTEAGWTKPYTASAGGKPLLFNTGVFTGTSSTTSPSITNSNPQQVGIVSFLVVETYEAAGTHTITTPTGWTRIVNHQRFGGGANGFCANVYFRFGATIADTSGTFSLTSSLAVTWGITYIQFSGGDPLDLYVLTEAGASAGTSQDTPAVTTENDNDAVLSLLFVADNDPTLTVPSGYTTISAAGNVTGDFKLGAAYTNKATAGATGALTWTKSADNGTSSYGVSIAIKGATGAFRAAYRQASGNQRYLMVTDNGYYGSFNNNGLGGSEAGLRMAATLSAFDTGTNLWPAGTSQATWGAVKKSGSCDSTARPWVIVANETNVYMMFYSGENASYWTVAMFGDFESFISGDAYNTFLLGRIPASSVTSETIGTSYPLGSSTSPSEWMLRNYLNTGSGIVMRKFTDSYNFYVHTVTSGASSSSAGLLAFPNPQNGAIYAAPYFVHEDHAVQTVANVIRGRIPGFYSFCHDYAKIDDQTVFEGTGDYAGKTLLFFKNIHATGAATGVPHGMFIEISDTWS